MPVHGLHPGCDPGDWVTGLDCFTCEVGRAFPVSVSEDAGMGDRVGRVADVRGPGEPRAAGRDWPVRVVQHLDDGLLMTGIRERSEGVMPAS